MCTTSVSSPTPCSKKKHVRLKHKKATDLGQRFRIQSCIKSSMLLKLRVLLCWGNRHKFGWNMYSYHLVPGFPDYFWKFERLNLQTSLWVGCSDGRDVVTYYIAIFFLYPHCTHDVNFYFKCLVWDAPIHPGNLTSTLKIGLSKRKGSSSNHHCSGSMLLRVYIIQIPFMNLNTQMLNVWHICLHFP